MSKISLKIIQKKVSKKFMINLVRSILNIWLEIDSSKLLSRKLDHSAMAVFNDYTPSQASYTKPKRTGLTSINQNYLNSGLRNGGRYQNLISNNNRSVEASNINKTTNNEYDNMLNSNRKQSFMRKDPISINQKEVMSSNQDITAEVRSTRNQLNPITGDFMTTGGIRKNQPIY